MLYRSLTPSTRARSNPRPRSPFSQGLNGSELKEFCIKSKRSQKNSLQPTRPVSQNEEATAATPQLLEKIRKRQQTPKKISVSPEIVSEVIRSYLLPMFKHEEKIKTNSKRSKSFGLPTKINQKKLTSTDFQGSIYTELKFSDVLSSEKNEIIEKIQEIEAKYKEIKQENLIISDEYNKLLILHNNLQSDHNILKFVHDQYLSISHYNENSGAFLKLQAEKYSRLLKDSKKDLSNLNDAFTQIKQKNDIRLSN